MVSGYKLILFSLLLVFVADVSSHEGVKWAIGQSGYSLFIHEQMDIEKEPHCHASELFDIARNSEELLYYENLVERCNKRDSCMSHCRLQGLEKQVGGGCEHVCF